MKSSLLCLGFAVLLCGSRPLHATVLFSTLGAVRIGDPSNNFVGSNDIHASDFLTGPTGAVLLSATVALRNEDVVDHNYTISIWSDASGTPGALVGSFQNIDAPSVVGIVNYVTTSVGGISLSANTPYWFLVSIAESLQISAPDVIYVNTPGANPGGVFSPVLATGTADSANAGATWIVSTPGNSLDFELDGTTVPEPGTGGLIGGAVLALGGARLARRRMLTP